MDPVEGTSESPRTLEEIEARQTDIKSRVAEINNEYRGALLDPETDAGREWASINHEYDHNEKLIGQLKDRAARVAELDSSRAEDESRVPFQTRRPGVVTGDDIYDTGTIRATSRVGFLNETRDRAKRSVDTAMFPEQIDEAVAKRHIERLIDRLDDPQRKDGIPGEVSERILTTGSPIYKRALGKYILGQGVTADEQRALSVGTGSAGGFAIVYTLDPTIIPTSNLSVNPYREFCSVETIAGTNEWRGVTSAGVTATRRAEAAPTTDASPTLAQPSIVVSKVDCFVPVSIELTQDWGNIQSDLATLIVDAKDDEEATSFTTGTYGAATSPGGLITGATTTVTAGGTAAFAVADIYKLWEALPPRFRARASFLGNLFTYDKVRQFDTAGGASLWVPNLQVGLTTQAGPTMHGSLNGTLLSKPSYESTVMASALTTGSKILAVGDGRLYKIVDRIGMDIEVIPHLFGAAQGNLPTGQRGFYAYWRNSAKVLDPNGFRVLVTG